MSLNPDQIPILLTSSVIAHDPRVKLSDTSERLHLALESVYEWLKINPSQPIVLCDGSSFDFSDLVQQKFPGAHIECLCFENNQDLVRQHGRGYGEGEIVRYAINNSALIQNTNAFAKCSSKLWVENFYDCALAWQGNLLLQGVFLNVFQPWKNIEFSYIDTRFYVASCSMYREYFEDAHLRIDEKNQFGLENAFHQIFIERDIQNALSPVAPVICGVGGGIGKYYKASLKRRLKEDLRLFAVKKIQRFKRFFIRDF